MWLHLNSIARCPHFIRNNTLHTLSTITDHVTTPLSTPSARPGLTRGLFPADPDPVRERYRGGGRPHSNGLLQPRVPGPLRQRDSYRGARRLQRHRCVLQWAWHVGMVCCSGHSVLQWVWHVAVGMACCSGHGVLQWAWVLPSRH